MPGKTLLSDFRPLILLALSVLVAVATVKVSKIALLVGLGILGYGWLQTFLHRNRNGEAHLYSALIVGAEVYFKMSFAGLPWEFAKIATWILLLTGILVERRKRPIPLIMVIYALLLIPGIFARDWSDLLQFKHDLMMNLSGELTLIIAVFYFYKRPIGMEELLAFGRMLIYGVTLMAATVYLKAPDYAQIAYGGGSNFAASGGFGPNQVSAIFGVGVFVTGFFLLQNVRLFLYRWIDLSLLIIFSLQGLFTLSRGGLIAAWVALAVSALAIYLFNPKQVLGVLKVSPLKILLLAALVVFAFNEADTISGGAVSRRYFNVDQYGEQIKEDYSTHRIGVVESDLKTFKNFWITGAGVGGGAFYREEDLGFGATHVEFSRLLADHGLPGLFALIIMFAFPLGAFFRRPDARQRLLLAGFVSLALLTMSHNAMRLAMPGFFYGFGFVLLHWQRTERDEP